MPKTHPQPHLITAEGKKNPYILVFKFSDGRFRSLYKDNELLEQGNTIHY